MKQKENVMTNRKDETERAWLPKPSVPWHVPDGRGERVDGDDPARARSSLANHRFEEIQAQTGHAQMMGRGLKKREAERPREVGELQQAARCGTKTRPGKRGLSPLLAGAAGWGATWCKSRKEGRPVR